MGQTPALILTFKKHIVSSLISSLSLLHKSFFSIPWHNSLIREKLQALEFITPMSESHLQHQPTVLGQIASLEPGFYHLQIITIAWKTPIPKILLTKAESVINMYWLPEGCAQNWPWWLPPGNGELCRVQGQERLTSHQIDRFKTFAFCTCVCMTQSQNKAQAKRRNWKRFMPDCISHQERGKMLILMPNSIFKPHE